MQSKFTTLIIPLVFFIFTIPVLAQSPMPLCVSPMPVSAFPRPVNDNGWGIHWGPGAEAQEPAAVTFFTNELKKMNIKWVKILNRGTGFAMDSVVDSLVGADMMPIIRIQDDNMKAIYPPDIRRMVSHYRQRGVPYFELYNEPNLLDEWPLGESIDIGHVADVWIPAAAAVQDAGGYPSTPALAPGGHWEDMDFFRTFLREVRRRAETGDDLAYQALCDGGTWLSVHDYGLNHYFDYPRDAVSQQSVPVSQAEIDRYGIEGDWIQGLNEARAQPNPNGTGLLDDSNGFYKVYAYAEIFKQEIGYVPPVIVTEGGWRIGDNQDGRYPPVTKRFMTNETLRGYDYMLNEAPDFFLAWSPWLLCNFSCNGMDGHFEKHAWYPERNTEDALPIVAAMKSNPERFESRASGRSLPAWVSDGAAWVTSSASSVRSGMLTLVRTPMELLLDTALRLGHQRFQMVGGSDAIRIMPDPLAATNRFLVSNITSRPAVVDISGQILALSPFGGVVVEIRPRMTMAEVGGTKALTVSNEYAGRMATVRLPGESEADFEARVNFDGTLATPSSVPAIAKVIENPYDFGVVEYRRLSCDENRGKTTLFVSVQDEKGLPLDGVKLLFNTSDGTHPIYGYSGDKAPNTGKTEFSLIAGPGRGGEWTIEVADESGGSPRAVGLRTDLPDDPCPSRGNTFGHYSYSVTFRAGAGRGVPLPREPLQVMPPDWRFPLPRQVPAAGESVPRMTLQDFPRPQHDNGLGLHFLPVGAFNEYALDLFIYHLKELDMRWATVYYSSEETLRAAAKAFKKAGIMVIWRPQLRPVDTYPSYLVERDIAILYEAGMPPYIQLYNEPTVGQEWNGAADLGLYRRNFIQAADAVYRAGGYVGFQDVDVANLTALIRDIKAQNKDYLFADAFFVPHCYGSNHPPDYPYDALNQGDTGSTIETDYNTSVLCFEKFAQVWQAEAGFVPPMVMGEGGWATSILEDGRYPRITPDTHRDYHLEMFNWFKTGVLSDGKALPDYLFAVTPWLVSAAGNMQFEENGWYYSKLTGTKYETIEAVRAMPPFERRFRW